MLATARSPSPAPPGWRRPGGQGCGPGSQLDSRHAPCPAGTRDRHPRCLPHNSHLPQGGRHGSGHTHKPSNCWLHRRTPGHEVTASAPQHVEQRAPSPGPEGLGHRVASVQPRVREGVGELHPAAAARPNSTAPVGPMSSPEAWSPPGPCQWTFLSSVRESWLRRQQAQRGVHCDHCPSQAPEEETQPGKGEVHVQATRQELSARAQHTRSPPGCIAGSP